MTTPTPLANAWRAYQREVIIEATDEQRGHLRNAFYGGAAACFWSIQHATSQGDPGDDITPQEIQIIEALSDELEEFREAVLMRRPDRQHG